MQRQIHSQVATAAPVPAAGGPTTTSPLPPSIRMDASTDVLIKALNKVSNELSEVLVGGDNVNDGGWGRAPMGARRPAASFRLVLELP